MLTELSAFRHRTPVVIRYADIDMLGHVNHARYLTYAEDARVRYAADVLGWDGRAQTLGLILARLDIDYLASLFYGDRVCVHTRCARLGGKSFTLEYLFARLDETDAPQAVVARAGTVLVAYDTATQQTLTLPDAWRAAVRAFEGFA